VSSFLKAHQHIIGYTSALQWCEYCHKSVKHHPELSDYCPGFTEKKEWHPNSPDLNPLDHHVWGSMPEKYHKFQPKPKTTDKLKLTLQTILEELPQEHNQQSELHQALDCHFCVCQPWSFRTSAETVHFYRAAWNAGELRESCLPVCQTRRL